MPPRYAYWTILVDEQPTAFRAADQETLEPTFNRLKQKHPSARMVWFQNGKVWNSRVDAQEAMRARGERGRAGDYRQRETLSERRSPGTGDHRESKGDFRQRQRDRKEGKLDWKPKGSFVPAAARPKDHEFAAEGRESRRSPEGVGGRKGGKLEWKPKSEARPKPEWRPKDRDFAAEGRESRRSPKGVGGREGGPRLEWRPKGAGPAEGRSRRSPASPPKPEGRRWEGEGGRPKGAPAPAEGRSRPSADREGGREGGRRPKTWRPGGDHKDPRQKYKDAKKAKWGRFKQTIRKRWEAKQPRKKKDGE